MKKTMKTIVLEMEENRDMLYDISYRGGNYGAKSGDVIAYLFPTVSNEVAEKIDSMMPGKFGCYCNYLGGGIRGAIARSDYDAKMPKKYARRLDAFTLACKARYEELEGDMNNEEDEDGETNWDGLATKSARASGIVSAY